MNEPCCPNCGSEVHWDYTCHTYGNDKDGWMACINCDSAILYVCNRDYSCWNYTDGLNPRNPSAQENEIKRPSWLDEEEYKSKLFGYDERVKSIMDME